VAAGAIRRSVDATTGVPSLDWADKLDSLHEAVKDLDRITARSVQVSESIRTLHGVDAPRQVHVTSESTSEVVHHVVPVSIDECLRVMAANTGVPALPAAVDEAPPRSIQ
jgi:hypothetical protein